MNFEHNVVQWVNVQLSDALHIKIDMFSDLLLLLPRQATSNRFDIFVQLVCPELVIIMEGIISDNICEN